LSPLFRGIYISIRRKKGVKRGKKGTTRSIILRTSHWQIVSQHLPSLRWTSTLMRRKEVQAVGLLTGWEKMVKMGRRSMRMGSS